MVGNVLWVSGWVNIRIQNYKLPKKIVSKDMLHILTNKC